jgi:hypothetical protein
MRSKRLAALALAVTTVTLPAITTARADVSTAHVVSASRYEVPRQGSDAHEQTRQWRYRLVIVIGTTTTYGTWSEWHLGPVKLPTIAQPRNGYAYFQVQKRARMVGPLTEWASIAR